MSAKPEVLLVDDDIISQKFLEKQLAHLGYSFRVAQNGTDAWRMFQEKPTRLVVCDWFMPDIDGLELCQKIREHQARAGDYTFFILVTSHHRERDFLKAMEAGVDDFMAKPVQTAHLNARLRMAVRIISATTRIQSLEKIVTLCAYTKRIQMPEEGWQSIEDFIENHLGLKVSHGVDPDYCQKVLIPEVERLKNREAGDSDPSI